MNHGGNKLRQLEREIFGDIAAVFVPKLKLKPTKFDKLKDKVMNDLDQLKADVENLAAQKTIAETNLQSANLEIKSLTDQVTISQDALEKAPKQSDLDAANATIADLQSKIAALDTEVKNDLDPTPDAGANTTATLPVDTTTTQTTTSSDTSVNTAPVAATAPVDAVTTPAVDLGNGAVASVSTSATPTDTLTTP